MPRQTTPVWESETLLSIGLVIGLMQFPPLLDALLLWGTVRLGSLWQPLLTFTFLYAKVALYALIVTFVVHLILRGFWVAALGMRAVFPQAIDWEKVSKGRISREFAKANTPSLTQVAERNDNAASAMFAFGFLLFGLTAMIMLVTLLSAAIGAGIALAIPGLSPVTVIFALIAVVVVPMIVGQTIDRYFGARIAPGSGAERALRWLLIPGLRLFHRPTVNGLMVPLIGRMGHFKAMLIILAALYALIAVVSMQMAVLRGASATDSYTFVPDSNGQLVLDPRHYASQRREPRLQASSFPFVQSASSRSRTCACLCRTTRAVLTLRCRRSVRAWPAQPPIRSTQKNNAGSRSSTARGSFLRRASMISRSSGSASSSRPTPRAARAVSWR